MTKAQHATAKATSTQSFTFMDREPENSVHVELGNSFHFSSAVRGKHVARPVCEFSIPRGILAASPIVLAYLPVGFTLGVLACQLGFSFFEALVFFAGSFSGSGQSVSLQSLRSGQPILSVWLVVIILNLRYFLMSSALMPYLGHWSPRLRYLFSVFVTDETFALHSLQFRTVVPPPSYVFAVNLTAWVAWIVGGLLGQIAGAYVADVRPYGFDFAVPGMFIALVVLQIENRRMLFLGVLGAAMGATLALSPLRAWAVLLSGVLCATLGLWMEKWTAKIR